MKMTCLAAAIVMGLMAGGYAQAGTPGRHGSANHANTLATSTAAGSDAAPATPTHPKHVSHLHAVQVFGEVGYATLPRYDTKKVDLGPLGTQSIKDTPMSVTVLPAQLLTNQQVQTVNQALRNLPSVTIQDQQGLEVSRPESRGFQGSIAQTTRMDGLNVVGTTAIPAENLASIQVLNGMTGSLYGAQPPAGVFNYVLKRPTARPIARLRESYASRGIFTEQVDLGGPLSKDGRLQYRFNGVHGEGTDYVKGISHANRTLLSGGLDYHFNKHTVLEANYIYYKTKATGLPGAIVYGGKLGSTKLPRAIDPETPGLGQPGAGTDLISKIGILKFKHEFANGWHFQAGMLHEHAIRNLSGITNNVTSDAGAYNVVKNFNSIPLYTLVSDLVQLNGHFQFLGTENDFSAGINGFRNWRHHYYDANGKKIDLQRCLPSGAVGHTCPDIPGATISNPEVFAQIPNAVTGQMRHDGTVMVQSLVLGDTMHFTRQWAARAVVSSSFYSVRNFNIAEGTSSAKIIHNAISPMLSVIYTPNKAWTAYATWSHSVQVGATAPSAKSFPKLSNPDQWLGAYHDKDYEAGVKWAPNDGLLLSADVFYMTQPFANVIDVNPTTQVFKILGTQRDRGMELFAQGSITPALSILGGITYVDAKLGNSGNPQTNNKRIVGIPKIKSDISLDYHPGVLRGVALIGTAHFETRRAATNSNNSFAPGYATFDFGARYSFAVGSHSLTLRAQVLNLTDKHYYAALSSKTISGTAVGANTAYYAPPRTYMASVEIDL